MKSTDLLKRLRSILLLLLSLFLLYVAGILLFASVNDIKYERKLPGEIVAGGEAAGAPGNRLSFLIWNLGYGGLGAEADFFYQHSTFFSGKHMVRPPKDLSMSWQQGISDFLTAQKVDFILLQEADRHSKRSYFQDHVAEIGGKLEGFSGVFFPNYQVRKVVVPLLEPWHFYGEVKSGLASFSRFVPVKSERLQLPGTFPWPTSLFMLDRCLGVQRFRLKNGRQLVVVNVHNEAYDKGGKVKAQQMQFLKQFVLQEYEQGNYVVAGGDWNQIPPFFKAEALQPVHAVHSGQIPLDPELFPEGWHWVFDPAHPTNRSIEAPYQKGVTRVSVIDFFLISPNVRVRTVKCLDLDFRYSDHQPVWMEVQLLD